MSQAIEPTPSSVVSPVVLRCEPLDAQQLQQLLIEVSKTHQTVREFSRRLFGNEVTIELENDLEDNEPFFDVTGYASGSPESLASLVLKWHEELCIHVPDNFRFYCLTLIPKGRLPTSWN
jgi:hypothetical protein